MSDHEEEYMPTIDTAKLAELDAERASQPPLQPTPSAAPKRKPVSSVSPAAMTATAAAVIPQPAQPAQIKTRQIQHPLSDQKMKLYLCFTTKSTGSRISSEIISVGFYAATDGGLQVLKQEWRIKVSPPYVPPMQPQVPAHAPAQPVAGGPAPAQPPVGDQDEPGGHPLAADDDDVDLKRALALSQVKEGPFKYEKSLFGKLIWNLYWSSRQPLLDTLADGAEEQKQIWNHIGCTLDSFHVEYPSSRYDVVIICDAASFDIPAINFCLGKYGMHIPLWETFDPVSRRIEIIDIPSMYAALKPEVRVSIQQRVDMVCANDELPGTEAERLMHAYMFITE